jgi:hypothetical protein
MDPAPPVRPMPFGHELDALKPAPVVVQNWCDILGICHAR